MVKINALELENVKRIKAVRMAPSPSGLTIIGGDNAEGKTSVLDAIAWALGGAAFRPSEPMRRGSTIPPYLRVTLDNGLVVERKGKNGDLKVTDPTGRKAGQNLLDSFIEKLALDLPKFLQANDKEKAQTLLNIIGVGPQLTHLEQQEKDLYAQRLAVGRVADQKKKAVAEMESYADVPEELISAAELIKAQQEILARNGQRQQWIADYQDILRQYAQVQDRIDAMEAQLKELRAQQVVLTARADEARKSPEQLQMESTEELEAQLQDVEETNRKIRANMAKDKAEDEAKSFADQYDLLTDQLTAVRDEKLALLDGADLPLPGLSVEEGRLTYNGQQWDNMSGAEQLKVATAIVRKLNPECGFVLVDGLEQMDRRTLAEFGAWLEAEGLQVIATRVSTGDECCVIISDGYSTTRAATAPAPAAGGWKKGEF